MKGKTTNTELTSNKVIAKLVLFRSRSQLSLAIFQIWSVIFELLPSPLLCWHALLLLLLLH